MCSGDVNGRNHDGYVPDDLAIGGGDYVNFSYCLNCGQIQNNFPLPISVIEKDLSDSDVMDFFLNCDLKPYGFKSPESFWKMVDEAKLMSQLFSSFIMNEFRTEIYEFTNKVSGYNSPFNTWNGVFSAYKEYIKR